MITLSSATSGEIIGGRTTTVPPERLETDNSGIVTDTFTLRLFEDQDSVKAAFKAGKLDRDVVVVVRFQGPKANGMPELHGLTPVLSVLQARGHKVALVTDGRMSGASGKVPAAIHVAPEALAGGLIGKLADGDMIRVDAEADFAIGAR